MPTSALDCGSASGGADLVAALSARLGAGRVLLVLDNFEHVLPAAPLISELVAECPGMSVLATSRSPLLLVGEHLLQVPPLGLPDKLHSQVEDLARLRRRSAVRYPRSSGMWRVRADPRQRPDRCGHLLQVRRSAACD